MTAGSYTPSTTVAAPNEVRVASTRTAVAIEDARAARRVWLIVTVAVAGLYGLLFNPYWVPGGDSELYLAVARSWAQGHGHSFNGQFVSICPPGWPLVLAAVMKIAPTFAVLKLVTLTLMIRAMAMWYALLLRFMRPALAALIVLTTAIIQHVYSLSFWMHSDALFLVFSTAAMIVACQIREGRSHPRWRLALLLVLCFAGGFVRWAGILQWPVIAGFLLAGQPIVPLWVRRIFKRGPERGRGFEVLPSNGEAVAPVTAMPQRVQAVDPGTNPRAPQRSLVAGSGWEDYRRPPPVWLAVLLSGVVPVGTFAMVRQALHLTPQQEVDAKEAGATFDESQVEPAPTAESRTVDLLNVPSGGKQTLFNEIVERVRRCGKWFAWLLWPEMRFLSAVKRLSSIDTIFGWIVIATLLSTSWHAIQRRQWFWPAMALYGGVLCIAWPNPNARYLVPIAPMILWGVIRGVNGLGKGRRWGTIHRATNIAFIASVIVANAILFGIDVWVARSSDFYSRYEGGLNNDLISAAHFLDGQNLEPNELAVSEEYVNLGRRRMMKTGQRVIVMLTDRVTQYVPGKLCGLPTPRFASWARRRHVTWYLYQEPISPWRVWHFRLPGWLQQKLSGEPPAPTSAGWVLYHVDEEGVWQPVEVPPVKGWPKRVPGM